MYITNIYLLEIKLEISTLKNKILKFLGKYLAVVGFISVP